MAKKEKSKLSARQKEIIFTIIVLLVSVIVGFFIGKYLFDIMHK